VRESERRELPERRTSDSLGSPRGQWAMGWNGCDGPGEMGVDERDSATVKSAGREPETPRNGGKPKEGVWRRRTLPEDEEKMG